MGRSLQNRIRSANGGGQSQFVSDTWYSVKSALREEGDGRPDRPTEVSLNRPLANGRPTPSLHQPEMVDGGRPLAQSAWRVRVCSMVKATATRGFPSNYN